MSLRTVTIGIRSRFDRMLTQIENHEAVAASALADQERALARAAAQLTRLTQSRERLCADLARARDEAGDWRRRAGHCSDDTRALECLRRWKHRTAHATELDRRRETLDTLIARLERDVRGLEARHTELRERHRALRARESRAQAAELVAASTTRCSDVEDVFERWETQVTEQEYLVTPVVDPWGDLEVEFAREEERAELLVELQNLRGES